MPRPEQTPTAAPAPAPAPAPALSVPSGSGETGRLSLWLAVGAGALAWSAHLLVSYALVGVACATGLAWILHAVTLLTFLVTVTGGWVCLRTWWRCRREAGAGPRGLSADYQAYMGLGGTLLNALFAFVILLEGLPVALIPPCLGLG